MKKFCPKCGKTIEKGVFCSSCNEENLHYKPISIKLCPSRRYFHRGKWTKFKDLHSLTEKLIKDSTGKKIVLLQGLEVYEDLLHKPGLNKKLDVVINYDSNDYVLKVNVEVTYSPGVNKLGSTYFEGILQLRNATTEVKEYIKKFIAKNKDKKMYVNNTVEKGTSADYFFVNKHHIAIVCQKIIRNYGGFMHQNAQLFSHNKQTSKDLFRLNVLLQLPNFKVNDVINYEEKLILVKKTSKEISGFDLVKKKHASFQFNQKNADSIKNIKKQKTAITRIRPDLEIMNPTTYQEEKAYNPLKLELKPGQKIVVVEHKKKFYIIK